MLVSSFVASLLAGDYVAIDAADGSGMNLMDIRSKEWVPAALDCTAPGLAGKLGDIVPSHSVAGKLHRYYAEKYGFSNDCAVIAFSGDNPNSLAGLRLQNTGDIAVSLGTSDTVFGSLAEPAPSADEGHIFANPVDPDAYMALFCYKNGSLTREYVRDEFADGSWEVFSRLLQQTPVGNNGNIGFYIREPEITPPVMKTGTSRYDEGGQKLEKFQGHEDIRAVVEGQFLSMRLHAANTGIRPESILATGGASTNMAILKVMADVFGKPIRVAQQSDSASLGAAYRAMHGWMCSVSGRFVPFAEVLSSAPAFRTAVEPDPGSHSLYSSMLDRYRILEKDVVGK
jgi:xylulokinase